MVTRLPRARLGRVTLLSSGVVLLAALLGAGCGSSSGSSSATRTATPHATSVGSSTPTLKIGGGDDTPTPIVCCDCNAVCYQATGSDCGSACVAVPNAVCNLSCQTLTPTVTPTAIATATATATAVSCCDCGGGCFMESDSGCGSCDTVLGATCDGSACATFTPAPSSTATVPPTLAPTQTSTATENPTATQTATITLTGTVTGTWTVSTTPTITSTPTATTTGTHTFTATQSPTTSATRTATASATTTATWTLTATPTGTATPTPTTYCTPGVSAVCSATHTTIYAIAHSYNDPVDTILYRISVPAWLPDTNFGDGKNGFFYQVTITGNTTVISTYAPFNGVGVSSSGAPQLLPFEFIVAADVSSGIDDTSMIIAACSSDYVTPSSGSASTPSCTTMYWADTYSELFAPSVGEPPSGASLSFDTETFSLPNTGVYPATMTVEPSSTSGSTTDADWIYDHLIFADTQGNAYTNNLYDVSAPARRSFAALPLEDAGVLNAATGLYYTKFGSQTGVEAATYPDKRYLLYTRDQYASASSFKVLPTYIYDYTNSSGQTCTTFKGGVARCGAQTTGTVSGGTELTMTPYSALGGILSVVPENELATAGYQETRTYAFSETGSCSATGICCSSALNPLAINSAGTSGTTLYNQPNYILDDQSTGSGSWGQTFPDALYYVTPTGFGSCTGETPFCERGASYIAYAPQYAESGPTYGTLNGGSTSAAEIAYFALADEYQVGAIPSGSSNSNNLVWFDNCGYGYVYNECSGCTLALGTRKNLPSPPNSGTTYEYAIENKLTFPVVFGKACCASWYQANETTGVNEPPQQIDNANGIFVAAGQSVTYQTIFSDEAFTVYNAATGGQLFKLRLNKSNAAVYGCASSGWTAGVSEASGVYTVKLGSGSLTCGSVGSCPFGMTVESISGTEVSCVTTTSSFILDLPQWASETAFIGDTIQLRAWGASGTKGVSESGSAAACDASGGSGGSGGFALSTVSVSDLPDALYAYIGKNGSSGYTSDDADYYNQSGTSTVLATAPLDRDITYPQGIKNPGDDDIVLIAGGGAGGGDAYCEAYDCDQDGECKYHSRAGGNGGAGGVAIANDASTPGSAVSASGSTGSQGGSTKSGGEGGNPSPYEGGAGGSGAESGVGGFGGKDVKWDDSGSLIPPPTPCANATPTQGQGEWCGGYGAHASSSSGSGDGGGGFGGGASGSAGTGDNVAGSGGGGGGSWAAANTGHDASAPSSAPTPPGGITGGAVGFVYNGATVTPTPTQTPVPGCCLCTESLDETCALVADGTGGEATCATGWCKGYSGYTYYPLVCGANSSVVCDGENASFFCQAQCATNTPTPTITRTPSITRTPTITLTPTVTRTHTITRTPTQTGTVTHTGTITQTRTITQTPTITHTATRTPTGPTPTPMPGCCKCCEFSDSCEDNTCIQIQDGWGGEAVCNTTTTGFCHGYYNPTFVASTSSSFSCSGSCSVEYPTATRTITPTATGTSTSTPSATVTRTATRTRTPTVTMTATRTPTTG